MVSNPDTLYTQVQEALAKRITEQVVPGLQEFIRIPNLSRMFDTEFMTNGLIQKACKHVLDYATSLEIEGLDLQMYEVEGRTPLVFGSLPASVPDSDKTIFIYGHIDKQPHLTGWKEGLGPCNPVIRDGKLYGRGGGDDGYASFSSLAIMKTLQELGIQTHRVVFFFETDEESGAKDTGFWIERMSAQIGSPDMVFILDSGALDYDHLYITGSLRGSAAAILNVKTHNDGVHSGEGSGVIPDTFRIVRNLLSRIEDPVSGELLEDLYVTIPPKKYAQCHQLGTLIGDSYKKDYPFLEGVEAVPSNGVEALLNKGWRPTLTITGADGLPPTAIAGNVSRPETSVKLSIRCPPTLDAAVATQKVKEVLEANPPYGAHVTLNVLSANSGWSMNDYKPEFDQLVQKSALAVFGNDKPVQYNSMGGSIPLVGMMNKKFPSAQFVVTGVLGPESNAHCPNEMVLIPYLEKVMFFLARIIGQSSQVL